MKFYLFEEVPGYLRRAGVGPARMLWKNRFVRNLREEENRIRGLVFDPDLVEPAGVDLRWTDTEFSLSCDCGAQRPCIHGGALIFALHEHSLLPPEWPLELVQHALDWEEAQEPETPGRNDRTGEQTAGTHEQDDLQLDLFSSQPVHKERTGKKRHSGFGTQKRKPKPGETQEIDLFLADPENESEPKAGRGGESPRETQKTDILSTIPEFRTISRGHVVFLLVPHDQGFYLSPCILTPNSEKEGFLPYQEGVLYRTLPEQVEVVLALIQRNLGQGMQTDVHHIIGLTDEWEPGDHYRKLTLPLHASGNTIPAKMVKVSHLAIQFVRVDQDGDAVPDGLFFPLFTWHFESGARPLNQRGRIHVWTESGQLYWYQEDRNWLCFHDAWHRELRFLGDFREFREAESSNGDWLYTGERILSLQHRIVDEGIISLAIEFSPEENRVYSPMPRCLVMIQGNERGTEIYVSFRYKTWEVPYQHRELDKSIPDGKGGILIIRRNLDGEAALVHNLVQILGEDVLYERGYYATEIRGAREADLQVSLPINDFLLTWAGQLIARNFEVRIENRKVRLARDVSFSVERNMDWFGIQAEVELDDAGQGLPAAGPDVTGWSFSPPSKVLSLEQDEGSDHDPEGEIQELGFDDNFQRLGLGMGAGDYILLKPKDIRRLEYLRRQGMTDEGVLQSSPANLMLIDAIYEKMRNSESEDKVDLEERRKILGALNNRDSLPQVAVPRSLNARLRPYQKKGLDWLVYLHEHRLSGCLADDMGLGKTLQTISLLTYLKERGFRGPALLVTPVVTLGNWEQELQRFSPGLVIHRHGGSGRDGNAGVFRDKDIILVSYHTLRIDIEVFLDEEFSYIILDEAHYIKNHFSQVFKAVRSLRSRFRLSLTGTPIENTLMELWSQMNFLNPGLLGTAKSFYERYFVPIERQGNDEALDELKEIVGPFILRRTKEEVLDDLPSKEIIVHYCEMDDQQAKVYREMRDWYRDRILGIFTEQETTSSGVPSLPGPVSPGVPEKQEHKTGKKTGKTTGKKGASIEIFQFLLKLRQLAIHPPLAGPEHRAIGSAKMEGLLMLLEDILTEQHKVLIFSQFLGTLEIIGQECQKKGWKYSLLTGSTADRNGEISRFQNDSDTKVFLLSLKAGGVGINLTAADYVILFDPWWNPAAEKQAIDRAHRMGQKNKVIAYKLIVRGTIEEKILQLQERKHALAQEIVAHRGNFISGLDSSEVVDLFS